MFLLLKAIFTSVCLKRLVIFLTLGLLFVNVAHFVFVVVVVVAVVVVVIVCVWNLLDFLVLNLLF